MSLCGVIAGCDGATKALHLVSAFATEARLVLEQTKLEQKSNKITAIPELLHLLDLRGGVVSIEVQGTRVLLKGQAITTLQATLCV